MYMLYYYVL